MTYEQLLHSTPRQFTNRMRGYSAQLRESERAAWERTRWQTTLLLNIHIDPAKRLKQTDLLTFPDEQQKKQQKTLSPEQIERNRRLEARMDELAARETNKAEN